MANTKPLASQVIYKNTTVQDILDSGASKIVTEERTAGSVQDLLVASTRSSRFRSILDLKEKDAYILLQGDSTGNEDWEFFYLFIQEIATLYPTHTVYYRLWNDSTKTWDSRTIQTGTGPRVLRAYNGSVPGSNPEYWAGVNKNKAYDGFQFDSVIVNYGLNTATSEVVQASSIAAHLYAVRQEQPDAEIVGILQPPDYTDTNTLNRSQLRVDAQRKVFADFGVTTCDLFSLFTELVNYRGGVDAWYGDKIHPNVLGQQKWADTVYGPIMSSSGMQRAIPSGPCEAPNGDFLRWADGMPVWWRTNNSVTRDTSQVETGRYSAKVFGRGTGNNTGTFFFDAFEFITKREQSPQIVVAARVLTTGTSDIPGTVYMSTGDPAGPDYVEIRGNGNGFQGVGSGKFRWAFLIVPKSFYHAKTNHRIGVFSGTTGQSVVVDRILVGTTPLIPQSNGEMSFEQVYTTSENSVSVPANSYAGLNLSAGSARLSLRKGANIELFFSGNTPDGVIYKAEANSSEVTRIVFNNITSASVTVPAMDYFIRVS